MDELLLLSGVDLIEQIVNGKQYLCGFLIVSVFDKLVGILY